VRQSWTIPEQDDPEIEILYMAVSVDESRIGIALGKTIIKDEKEIS
jgi:hypothetical protein